MGRVRFKRFYTDLVEHFLRMTVRHKNVVGTVPKQWHDFTNKWIESLSDEDKNFILFVFDRRFFNSYEGVSCSDIHSSYDVKLNKLANLEKDFAIKASLFSDDTAEINAEWLSFWTQNN